MTPKAQATRAKKDKCDYTKLKSFYTTKETIHKMKKQSTEWEEIVASKICGEGLISKLYKELLLLN